MSARTIDMSGRFAYSIASFVLTCSVIVMNLSLPASALSLGDLTGNNDTNSSLLSPVTDLVNQVTDTVLPAITDPIDQNILPGTNDLVQGITSPVTDIILPDVSTTVDTVLAPVAPVIQTTTDPVVNAISPITNNLLPTVTTNVITPVISTVTTPLKPVAQTIRSIQPTLPSPQQTAGLVNRTRSPIILASTTTNQTTPAIASVASFAATPSLTQSIATNSSNPSFSPMAILTGVASFFTSWPMVINGLNGGNFGKRVDNSSIMLLTAVMGAMLIIFVSMIYRMISKGKYGIRASGQNFMQETAMYGSMAKLSLVTFATLGIGSIVLYLILITL